MTINRRQFVQSSVIAGAGILINPARSIGNPKEYTHFGLNQVILQNPDAVFIMETNVDKKTNSVAMKSAGLDFGRSVFMLTNDTQNGTPLSNKIVIKPNLTCRYSQNQGYTIEGTMGIITDAYFVEGVIESLKEIGIPKEQFYIREVNNCFNELEEGGYPAMAERTGIDLQANNTPASQLSSKQIVWKNVPDGVWFKRIPYLWPVNAPDTWLLNISKFKTHHMGLTLCAKNLQGTIAYNYQAHCTPLDNTMTGVSTADIQPTAQTVINNSYLQHKKAGIPRWDKPGSNLGGIWMETWASRCIDNNSVTFAGLHVIEGIYGRNGDFVEGPDTNGLATDFMTNYIIFGKNEFHVDIIGHYLAGHEPGNFGLFHLAKERGMTKTFNPAEIPLFNWGAANGPIQADLAYFQRFPLLTCYLQKNYAGQNEPYWHLVNEPYDYGTTGITDVSADPYDFSMKDVFPNPLQNKGSIRFYIPKRGLVFIEMLNGKGHPVDILFNQQMDRGNYTVSINGANYSSGLHMARMHFDGSVKTQKVIVSH